jgi:hypothetical protein
MFGLFLLACRLKNVSFVTLEKVRPNGKAALLRVALECGSSLSCLQLEAKSGKRLVVW